MSTQYRDNHPHSRPHTGTTVATLALTAALMMGALTGRGTAAAATQSPEPVDAVNTFIGTKGDGNTFPGASMPFGMVQVSPDTGHYAGYRWDDSRIRGFSLTHVSGVGCGLAGDQPMLPMIGRPSATDYAKYALPYSHDSEKASPGRYEVQLDDPDGAITVELTATQRTAMQRYTFAPSAQSGVMINVGQALHGVQSTVHVVDSRTIDTTITGNSFCRSTEPYTLYVRTVFDRDMTSFKTWTGNTYSDSKDATGDGRHGVWVGFDTTTDRDVVATSAVSWVDAAGATKNLAAEATTSFDDTAAAARQTWVDRLGRVSVTGGSDEQRRTFYSSLYRSLLGPTRGDDVDGRYRGWDDRIHTTDGYGYYQTSSLWDTYRAQIQLLALVAPTEARDQTISLILQGEQGGWLPKWGYATVETNIMTGDPVTPQIVAAHQLGLLKGWEDRAWAQLTRNADGVPPEDSPSLGRAANEFYLAHGYVPHEMQPCPTTGDCDFEQGGSATLEYAVADAAMAVMAKSLGKDADYQRYAQRSASWRNVFTPDTRFPRARDAKGVFVGNPDPAWSVGFHEGTAWQYQWLVPQNIPSLISEIGGDDATNKRLDEFFAYDQLLKNPEVTARNVWVNSAYDYYGQKHYNPQNEPDLHSPYVYLWTGQPWKTADVVRAALTLFRDGPDGITGNDDVGTMSAWHVLSSLGIYPAMAGTDQYVIGSPIFDSATIQLGAPFGSGKLVINAPQTSATARYVQSVTLDGQPLNQSWITSSQLASGATVNVAMGESRSQWGVGQDARPPAVVPTDGLPGRQDLQIGVTSSDPLGVLVGTAREIKATATITVTNTGPVTGTVSFHAPAGITVTGKPTLFTVQGDGTPQVVTIPLTISVPADAKPGDVDVTVTVTAQGKKASDVLTVSVVDTSCAAAGSQCILDLDDAYDLDGVAPSSGAAGQGNLDGMGWAYAQELLPTPGVHLVGDTAVKIPDTSGTAPNFVSKAATFNVGHQVDRVTLLAAAVGGDAAFVPFTLTYADGSKDTATIMGVTDWCTSSPHFADRLAWHMDQRVQENKGLVGPACNLWLVDVPTDATKTLDTISWQGDDRMRIMAATARLAETSDTPDPGDTSTPDPGDTSTPEPGNTPDVPKPDHPLPSSPSPTGSPSQSPRPSGDQRHKPDAPPHKPSSLPNTGN